MNNNTHPCANKCGEFKEGGQCFHCFINQTVNQGVYSMHRTGHRIDHIVEPNNMGGDSHIENHNSPLIERLKVENVVLQAKVDELTSENKMLHKAAATHLRNQHHFKGLYDALVEQLYPYALDLNESPNFPFFSLENCSLSFKLGVVGGYKTASVTASFEILEMLKGDEEYIRAQCGMLGGGGEV